jgi:hypothetical protein
MGRYDAVPSDTGHLDAPVADGPTKDSICDVLLLESSSTLPEDELKQAANGDESQSR